MMKISMVEIHPPPNFHAAAPARIPLSGPSIHVSPWLISEHKTNFISLNGKIGANLSAICVICGFTFLSASKTSATPFQIYVDHVHEMRAGRQHFESSDRVPGPFQTN